MSLLSRMVPLVSVSHVLPESFYFDVATSKKKIMQIIYATFNTLVLSLETFISSMAIL